MTWRARARRGACCRLARRPRAPCAPPGSATYTASAMTRALLDSFWRAAAYCFHPKVVALSLAPLAIVGGLAAALGYFFWEPAVAGVRGGLEDAALLEPMFAWLRSIGGASWASVIAPLVIVALAVPVFVVASLLRRIAADDAGDRRAWSRRGASRASSGAKAVACGAASRSRSAAPPSRSPRSSSASRSGSFPRSCSSCRR